MEHSICIDTEVKKYMPRGDLSVSKAKAVARKIAPQFPDSPEGRLMLAVVSLALYDSQKIITDKSHIMDHRNEARNYLLGGIPHAVAVGVNPTWIREIIANLNMDIELINI